jgi:hypothetical protein
MTTTPDQFAQSFDAIEIDRTHRPSTAAIDSALAACVGDQPGFYLADDADGRFVVDREFGVISLCDEALLATEHGRVHEVKLRVVQAAGDSYTLDLKLRVTGMVPQMVGAEDIAFGADAASVRTAAAPACVVPWTAFSAARGRQAAHALTTEGAFGALLTAPLPPSTQHIVIALDDTIPAPASGQARWSI